MGDLLTAFTFPRNCLKKSPEEAAQKALNTISRAERGELRKSPDGRSIKDEDFNDARIFLGTVGGEPTAPSVLKVGRKYQELHARNSHLAWQWLLTRSMWLWTIPNASKADSSKIARDAGMQVNFFDLVMRTLHHLQYVQTGSTLLFQELLPILDEDTNWRWSTFGVAPLIEQNRAGKAVDPATARPLLEDLEEEFRVPRDNLAGTFRKAFGQCGLVDLVRSDAAQVVGLKLSAQARSSTPQASWLEFVLSHPKVALEAP